MISVLIPAHNEAISIAGTIQQLESDLNLEHEVIVVNDHSSDETAQVVKELSQKFSNIILVDNNHEMGLANALRTGFDACKGDLIVPMMADFCDDPWTINKMYYKINEGYDIVCGSRYMSGGRKIGGPRLKSFFSRFVGLSLHYLIGIPTYDIANSFKMYKKEVIRSITTEAEGFEISVELPLKAFFSGYEITEVPTTWIDRKRGKSKFHVLKQGSNYFKLYIWALWKEVNSCFLKRR